MASKTHGGEAAKKRRDAEKWQAKACAKCLAGTHLSIKKGPNGMVTPVAPLPSSGPLPVSPFVFAIVQQRRAAFSVRLQLPSAASAPHLPCWGKQAGLKNHGAGNPWDRGPSKMLSEINGCKLMTFEPFCSSEKCSNSISTKMSILEPSCSNFTTCWCLSAFCSSRTYWSAVLPQLSLLAETL